MARERPANDSAFDRLWWMIRYQPPLRALAALKHRIAPGSDLDLGPAAPASRPAASRWIAPTLSPTMTGPRRFRFLGIERELSDNRGWRWKPWGEEWLAQLHAFDDLVADDAASRHEWHQSLISNWTLSNHPGKGVGWAPSSLPRRVVNWVKFGLVQADALPEAGRRSLVVQIRYLRQHQGVFVKGASSLEVGKALLFAGAFFQGAEADAWRRAGLSLVDAALKLDAAPSAPQGRWLVEDLLDLVQLARVYPGLLPAAAVARWNDASKRWMTEAAVRPGTLGAGAPVGTDLPRPSLQALFDHGAQLGLGGPAPR